MVADKIRGYYFHSASDLVAITFRGDWVMHNNGFLVRTSATTWDALPDELNSRSETLEAKITNIAEFCSGASLIGVKKSTLADKLVISIVQWYETEKEARHIAEFRDQKKIWDCKEKRFV